jgi:hypothetical protein
MFFASLSVQSSFLTKIRFSPRKGDYGVRQVYAFLLLLFLPHFFCCRTKLVDELLCIFCFCFSAEIEKAVDEHTGHDGRCLGCTLSEFALGAGFPNRLIVLEEESKRSIKNMSVSIALSDKLPCCSCHWSKF